TPAELAADMIADTSAVLRGQNNAAGRTPSRDDQSIRLRSGTGSTRQASTDDGKFAKKTCIFLSNAIPPQGRAC
ncbi:MAG: hypothetical protein V7703_21480, partial [Hyphomicrobiales bacterium]